MERLLVPTWALGLELTSLETWWGHEISSAEAFRLLAQYLAASTARRLDSASAKEKDLLEAPSAVVWARSSAPWWDAVLVRATERCWAARKVQTLGGRWAAAWARLLE